MPRHQGITVLQWTVQLFRDLLGLGRDVGDVTAAQMAMRALVVYVLSLALVRLGSKRFLSRATAYDVILAIMLGSVLSRAINGSASMLASLAGGATLVAVHWLIAFVTSRVDWIGPLVKGNPILLIEDGKIQEDGMRKAGLTYHDLEEQLRLDAGMTDHRRIQRAYLERNGRISLIRQDDGA